MRSNKIELKKEEEEEGKRRGLESRRFWSGNITLKG